MEKMVMVQYNGGEFQVIGETQEIWASRKDMATAFGTTQENVRQHINAILQDGELQEDAVCKNCLHTATDGKTYSVNFYNLDMIIAVGFRIRSAVGVRFRQWANAVIKQYATQGYVISNRMTSDELHLLAEIKSRNEQLECECDRLRQKLDYEATRIQNVRNRCDAWHRKCDDVVLEEIRLQSKLDEERKRVKELERYAPATEKQDGDEILVRAYHRRKPVRKTVSKPCQQTELPMDIPETVVSNPNVDIKELF